MGKSVEPGDRLLPWRGCSAAGSGVATLGGFFGIT